MNELSSNRSGYVGIRSVEASNYGKPQELWASSSGKQGQSSSFGTQMANLGTAGVGIYALWNIVPKALKSQENNVDFWYKVARRVENVSSEKPALDYFANIWNIFSRAGYASESLSMFTTKTDDVFFDISKKALSAQGRADTLEYLKKLGVKTTDLSSDFVAFSQGGLYSATLDSSGKLVKTNLLKNEISLMDKGKLSLAYVTDILPSTGLRNADGSIRASSVFGTEGFLPVSKNIGGKVRLLGNKSVQIPNAVKIGETYTSMALQRTSFLLDEMTEEAKKFLEFIDPKGESALFKAAEKAGVVPRLKLGSNAAMLGRYSILGAKVFAGWAILNQADHMMRGEGIEKGIGTAMTAGVLGYAGHKIGSIFNIKNPFMAVGGAALGIAGGLGIGTFSYGPMGGIANLVGNFNYLRAKLLSATPIDNWRRKLEEAIPNSTSFSTAMGVGIMSGLGATAMMRYFKKDVVVNNIHRKRYLSSIKWDTLEDLKQHQVVDPKKFNAIPGAISDEIRSEIDEFVLGLENFGKHSELQNIYGKVGDTVATKSNRLATLLEAQATTKVRKEIAEESGHWIGKSLKMIERAPFFRAAAYASVIGVGAYALATGQIAPLETPEEIRLKNSGQILEPVRRGQAWEFGSTPYEGTDILFYRPNWVARLKQGLTSEGTTQNRGAIEEFVLKNFTYRLEKEHYFDKPAPISSSAFDNVPFLYPLIKPLADLIKRPKLMHVGEWARIDEEGHDLQLLERSTGLDKLPDPMLGSISMSAPYSPYEYSRLIGKSWQDLTSLSGLTGFYARSMMNVLTGSKGFFNGKDELESFSKNTSMTRHFYDLHTGGGFAGIPFASEPIRRWLNKDNVDDYNPIENNMPDWLPEDLRYGNQSASLRYGGGEYRLPGAGYAQRFNEVKGLDPNDYPLLHRFNILGDVAPWSTEYRKVKNALYREIKDNKLTPSQEAFFYNYSKVVETRRDKRTYDQYIYNNEQYQKSNSIVDTVDYNSGTFTIQGDRTRYSIAGISNRNQDLIAQFNMSTMEAAEQKRSNSRALQGLIQPGQSIEVTRLKVLNNVTEEGWVPAGVKVDGVNLNKAARQYGFAQEDDTLSRYAMLNNAERTLAGGMEFFFHTANKLLAAPEYLTMFGMSPTQKFLNFRDVKEEYEQSYLYGEDVRLWQKPIGHWFSPALRTAAHNWLGIDIRSKSSKDEHQYEEYFDKLKYLKYQMLSNEAYEIGDVQSAKHYESVQRKTLLGGHGFFEENRFKNTMLGTENRYSLGFARELSPKRREEILDLMPDYKRRQLAGQYYNTELRALESLKRSGSANEADIARLAELRNLKVDQGYVRSKENQARYESNKREEESFADYMRREELSEWLENNHIPTNRSWVGYNPAVDLQDVKLKYIEAEGKDYHDFSIYPSQAKYIHRKSYITDEDLTPISMSINRMSLIHGAMKEANDFLEQSYSNISYNSQSPARTNDYVEFSLEQYHSINLNNLLF